MPQPAVIIAILEKTGHLRYPNGVAQAVPAVGDPAYPTSLTDPLVVNAVQSYQRMHARPLEPLIAKHYPGRTSPVVNADGQVGSATEELFDMPRCECPDYTDHSFSDTAMALGTGGWKECHETKDFHCVKIVELNDPPSHIQPYWEAVKKRFIEIERKIGVRILFTKDSNGANVSLTWVNSSDGWIGLATVGNRRETCASALANRWMRLLGTFTQGWQDVERKVHALVLLLTHEFGHVQSLDHSNGGIMSPFLDESRPENWLGVGDPHENNMRTMYGGKEYVEPTPPPAPGPGPTPPPTTPPGGIVPRWLITDERTGERYRLTKIAEV